MLDSRSANRDDANRPSTFTSMVSTHPCQKSLPLFLSPGPRMSKALSKTFCYGFKYTPADTSATLALSERTDVKPVPRSQSSKFADLPDILSHKLHLRKWVSEHVLRLINWTILGTRAVFNGNGNGKSWDKRVTITFHSWSHRCPLPSAYDKNWIKRRVWLS